MPRTLTMQLDDDMYAILDMFNNAVGSSVGVKRTVEDFAYILVSLGLIQVSKAIAPATDQEMRALTLNVLAGVPERADILAMYRQTIDEGRKKWAL